MKTILIIEDDQSIRESLQELIGSEGYGTILAENEQVGLTALANKVIDLVVLDLSMPVMDGKKFLIEIEGMFSQSKTPPIIIMTAAGPSDIPYYDRAKILRKPLDIEDILEKINKFL